MPLLIRKFSFRPDVGSRTPADEESLLEIEEARSWLAAQWRWSDVPALKLRESLLVDVWRWRTGGSDELLGEANDPRHLSENNGSRRPSTSSKDSVEAKELEKHVPAEGVPVFFPLWRKACICVSIVLMTGISVLAYTTISAVSTSISADLRNKSQIIQTLYCSIYLLGIALGSMLIAPLSEQYGRMPVYHASNLALVAALIGCSRANSSPTLLVLRLFSGMAGCSSLVLGGPTIRDIVYADEKCRSKFLWSLCRLCPLFGYIAAQFGTSIGRELIDVMDWRGMFRALAIGAVVVTAASALLLRETYGPKLQGMTAPTRIWPCNTLHTIHPAISTTSLPFNMLRPFRLLCTSPPVLLLSLYTTISNSYIFLLYTTLPLAFSDTYNSPRTTITLSYLGLGSGMIISLLYLLIGYPRISLAAQKTKKLEDLLMLTNPAAALMPLGLFLYGWSIHFHFGCMVPVLATAVIGAAFLTTFVPIQIYLIDSFTIHAASAIAPSILLPNIAGMFLPMATPRMLDTLGVEWMSSVLGCVALLLLPFPFLFVRYGGLLKRLW